MANILELPEKVSHIRAEDLDNLRVFHSTYCGQQVGLTEDPLRFKTLTYFAHKIPDDFSSLTYLLLEVIPEVVPPYKEDFEDALEDMEACTPDQLRLNFLTNLFQALEGKIMFVQNEDKQVLLVTYEENPFVVHVNRGPKKIPLDKREMIALVKDDIVVVKDVGCIQFDGDIIFEKITSED